MQKHRLEYQTDGKRLGGISERRWSGVGSIVCSVIAISVGVTAGIWAARTDPGWMGFGTLPAVFAFLAVCLPLFLLSFVLALPSPKDHGPGSTLLVTIWVLVGIQAVFWLYVVVRLFA